jgi:hypothetical protein
MAAETELDDAPVPEAERAAPVAASKEPRTPPSEPATKVMAPVAKKEPRKPASKKPAGGGPSIAEHPRAVRSVARAKSWGGLVGFLLGGYLSLPTSTFAEAILRALAAGVVCYVAAWASAVFVWRRLVVLEIKGREAQLLAPVLPPDARGPSGGGEQPNTRQAR